MNTDNGSIAVTAIHIDRNGAHELIEVAENDLVFFPNGSMTDASSYGSMTSAPARRTKHDSEGWFNSLKVNLDAVIKAFR